MIQKPCWWIFGLVIALGAPGMTAGDSKRGEEILRKMVEKYRSIDRYRDTTTVVMRIQGDVEREMKNSYTCTIQRPDRIAITAESGMPGYTVIFNGEKLWLHLGCDDTYAVQDAPGDLSGVIKKLTSRQNAVTGRMALLHLFSENPYESLTDGYRKIELVGEETLAGEKTFHILMRGDLEFERHLWVDAWNYLLRKVSTDMSGALALVQQMGMDGKNISSCMIIETHMKISEPLRIDPEHFIFTPPRGSKQSDGLLALLGMQNPILEAAKKELKVAGLREEWCVNLPIMGVVPVRMEKTSAIRFLVVHPLGSQIIYDHTGREVSRFSKPMQYQHARVIDMEGDGRDEVLMFSTWGSVLNCLSLDGRKLWEFSGGQGINDVCVHDVTGDGNLEVIVGFNGGTGLYMFSGNGEIRWKYEEIGNVWRVDAGDVDGDGTVEILTTSARGRVHVFDSKGRLKRTMGTRGYTNFVRVGEFIESNPGPEIITAGSGKEQEILRVRDGRGTVLWEHELGPKNQSDPESLDCSATQQRLALGTRDGRVIVFDAGGRIEALAMNLARGNSVCWYRQKDGAERLLVGSVIRGLRSYTLDPVLSSGKKRTIKAEGFHDNGGVRLMTVYELRDGGKIPVKRTGYDAMGRVVSIENPLNNTEIQWDYYENGQKKAERHFVEGKREGTWLYWYEDGSKKGETGYRDHRPHGREMEWDEEGKLMGAGVYIDGIGSFYGWYRDGSRRRMASYKGAEGREVEWYGNGNKKHMVELRDYKPHGEYSEWYENGNLKKQSEHRNGPVHGRMREWHANGQLKLESSMKNGIPFGKLVEYYDNGRKKLQGEFRDGKLHGVQILWYRSGAKHWQVTFIDGLPHGEYVEWDEDGKVVRKKNFHNGDEITEKEAKGK